MSGISPSNERVSSTTAVALGLGLVALGFGLRRCSSSLALHSDTEASLTEIEIGEEQRNAVKQLSTAPERQSERKLVEPLAATEDNKNLLAAPEGIDSELWQYLVKNFPEIAKEFATGLKALNAGQVNLAYEDLREALLLWDKVFAAQDFPSFKDYDISEMLLAPFIEAGYSIDQLEEVFDRYPDLLSSEHITSSATLKANLRYATYDLFVDPANADSSWLSAESNLTEICSDLADKNSKQYRYLTNLKARTELRSLFSEKAENGEYEAIDKKLKERKLSPEDSAYLKILLAQALSRRAIVDKSLSFVNQDPEAASQVPAIFNRARETFIALEERFLHSGASKRFAYQYVLIQHADLEEAFGAFGEAIRLREDALRLGLNRLMTHNHHYLTEQIEHLVKLHSKTGNHNRAKELMSLVEQIRK